MTRNRALIAGAAVLIAALVAYLLLWPPARPEPTVAAVQAVPADTGGADAAGAEKPAEDQPVAEKPGPAEVPPDQRADAPADDPATAAAVANVVPTQPSVAASPTEATAKDTVPTSAAPAPEATLVPPAFDVVRVETNGDAVLAGRAMAGSDVRVLDGGKPLGNVVADGRGQWVFVVDPPLAPGGHELSLESRMADGRTVASSDVVVVNVPLPQIAAASQATPERPAGTAPSAEAAAPLAAGAATRPAAGTAPALSPEAGTAEKPLAVLMPRTGQGPSRVLPQSAARQEGLAQGTLVLDSIDYDAASAVIGGRAEPGTRLLIYLDDALLGETTAAPDGRWSLALDRPLTVGLHRLRVDALDASGKVFARVETPFSRATLAEALPDETSVVVQPGNSLWRIARRVYGEGIRYSYIFEANQTQIRDPDLIYPGQIFKVPMATPAASQARQN